MRIRLLNANLTRLPAAAAIDPTFGRAYVRVIGLVDRPERLLRPDRALRVLRAASARTRTEPAPIALIVAGSSVGHG